MTFEEWYEENREAIEPPNIVNELSEYGWLQRAFEAGKSNSSAVEVLRKLLWFWNQEDISSSDFLDAVQTHIIPEADKLMKEIES